MSEPLPPHAVAVVGMGGRFPDASSLDDFWRNISNGVESLESLSDVELDAAGVPEALRSNSRYVRKVTALEKADEFDASFFGISPREAQIVDPQHRIFLECAWEALEHAGYSAQASQLCVGVYAGASVNTYMITQLLRDPALVAAVGRYQLMLGNDKDFLCTRASYKLDLHGPSLTIQTACSTSLVAVEVACRALQRGECDLALAGGVSVIFPQNAGYLYEEGMIFSPDGHCRPFDVDARGTRGGAGAGIVVLKRLADAVADRDTIHAVIRGSAINNDGGHKAGFTAPSIDGQLEVVAMAQALAGTSPRSISYVETHGTGTPLGDPIEIAALTRAFRASTNEIGFCRIGSLKANIGHLDAAAGVAGLIKTVLMLKHQYIPPLVNFRKPNPHLNLESSPFLASSSGSPWVSNDGPRRAGVSSFGIGGTNAHIVLEEAPVVAPSKPVRDTHLLVVSAKTDAALDCATENLKAHLNANSGASLTDIGWTLGIGRQALSHRRTVVVKDTAQAAQFLSEPRRMPVVSGIHEVGARTVAFLFSGQGSQHAGMGAGLYGAEPVYREALDRCADILQPHVGANICDVLYKSKYESVVNETRYAQPLLFATEYALASLWKHWGVEPGAMLGHSIGEYVAAHLAGVMSLEDALEIVAARGRLMQALPAGSMAAVHCAAGELTSRLSGGVEIAAINAPALCTISGPAGAVAELVKQLESDNIESRELHTSHAFHSPMMEPALDPFMELLTRIKLNQPRIRYISNVTGTWITPEQATSPSYYSTHLRRAVQFEAGVRTVAEDPDIFFLEVGPGSALTSLARLTLGKKRAKYVVSSLSHQREGRADGEAVLDAAGRLWLAGVELDWANLYAGASPRRVPLPTYPFQRKRYWVEAAPAAAVPAELAAVRHSDNVENWLFAPTWTREASHVSRISRMSGPWLLLAQRGTLAEAVIKALKEAGANPIFVERGDTFQIVDIDHFRTRQGHARDISEIVRHVRGAIGPVRGAIYLGSDSADDRASSAASYYALVTLAESLEVSPNGPPVRVIVATFGAESVLNEPTRNPAAAMALGPVLALPTEVPNLQMRAVDLDLEAVARHAEGTAKILVEEAANDGSENLVAWRDGCRWMRRFERLSLPPADPSKLPLKPRGVYLITGGLGGVGLTLARWLAANTSARLILTARTPLPPRENWDSWLAEHGSDDRTAAIIRDLKEIEKTGSEVMTAAADAADLTQMKSVVDLVRARWGNIDGVVHAAGVPGTGRIAFLKRPDDVQAVVSPKVDGLNVLVRLLGDTPLEFVALMSSVCSFLGAPGLCDYASANAVLDAFSDSETRPAAWQNIVSVDWGPWRDLGMATKFVSSGQRADLESYRQTTIPPAAGADAFARALSSGNRRVVVVPFDLPQHLERTLTGRGKRAVTADQSSTPFPATPTRERSDITVAQGPSTDIECRLAEIWTELLGIEQIGVDENFFELGGHSLLATRILARIDASIHVQLSLRDIFDAPTIRGLTEKILRAAPLVKGATSQKSGSGYSPLVLLRPGADAPPVFMVHPVGGSIMHLIPLAKSFPGNCPIYGIQAKGFEGGETPNDSVEVMAETYIKAITEMQPRGPYYLVGMCFGGLVAVEIARRLLARGDQIGLLAFLDTLPHPSFWPMRTVRFFVVRRIKEHMSTLRSLKRRETIPYVARLFRTVVERVAGRLRGKQTFLKTENSLPPAIKAVFESGVIALEKYQPHFYPGKVSYLACGYHTDLADAPKAVWKDMVGELEVQTVPGNYDEMVSTHSEYVASWLFERFQVTEARSTVRRAEPKKEAVAAES